MDKDLQLKLIEASRETGFSVRGFSRRDFVIMALIAQEVLLDEELLERVDLLSKYKGSELEFPALADKITAFLE